ncbi:unnamed protein product [Heligmosomoides polygyrus]|uniref:Choline/ethanolamine kinase n=1 Tax=Heligmosomoides polygyrus TaxID=6339 RepID=A0A183FVR9_HELPZ|nr:unnamed protein product [Heligmosomoides polygyrus]
MPTEMLKYFKSHDVLDLRSKILSLCADVLGGKWAEVRPESVSITHVRGGLTNLVYLVSRPTFSASDDEQPSTVLLRIQSQTDNEKLLTELVVFTSLAESGLGPKLLGIFPGGRFEEYIPSRHVSHHEVTDSRTCSLLARVLPRFHSTAVPISKRPSIVNMMREWLALFEEQGNSHVQMQTTSFQLHPNTFPPVVSTNDLSREIDIVEEFLNTSPSPVVFCHNDLTSGNLLISSSKTTTPSSAEEISLNCSDKETLSLNLVDFEFSAYNYRGFDLANYFCAAAIEHNLRDYPHYRIDLNKLQNRPIKVEFCKEYVREARKSGNLLISSSKTTTPSSAEEISLNCSDKETLSLNLVDFEFSAYNYRGFDLANYFCAAAIEHNLRDYPHYRIDLNKLQNRPIKVEFCKEYVREARKLNIHIKSEFSLLREINQLTPVVHLFWAIFNLFCEKDTLAIMDCGAYARDRLALYYQTRSIFCDH